jgi:hypothetical protein
MGRPDPIPWQVTVQWEGTVTVYAPPDAPVEAVVAKAQRKVRQWCHGLQPVRIVVLWAAPHDPP